MSWKPAEKNGCYLVISAYRLCIENIVNNTHLRKPGCQSSIWKLKVPSKVKNLIWRVYKDCFPTHVKLNSRGISCLHECVTCNDPYKDSYNIFFHFGKAIEVWQTTNIWHMMELSLNQFDNVLDIIFNLLYQVSATQA